MPVQLIRPKRFADDRGWFSETYHQRRLAEQGIDTVFCQDNHSLSRPVGTLRGLHFQAPPHAQAKLVRCVRGSIWDVAVDVRNGSPTFGQWVAATLSADNGDQLFMPAGFAHGFVTLEPDSEVIYKVDDYYAPDCDGGIAWDDPDIALPWPAPADGPVLSDKDRRLPRLAQWTSPFAYDGRPLQPLASL
ncbi:dTDP-4-dehydrorhamnose 3,5-epimerase [Sphingomonas profundi]|uniref:dTDP-4-dehydrorhamnose 3,5-epimerase n=1 Tax=Alterirhizorhabdus profundi TaxID=2681549 RepID=UPI0012E73F95|nr:dTDP-4-dehydrorhamnose 3,5-epimerase [Sphingomonas profundi]